MSRSHLLLLLVLLVGIGLAVWLLAGGVASGPGGDGVAREDEGSGEGDLGSLPGGAAGGAEGDVYDGPVLFGRPREQQVGHGLVAGKVAEAEAGGAVARASVLLTGTGFGDESVTLRVASDEGGGFRFDDVPAGPDYALRVEAQGFPGRTVPGVAVRNGSTTEVGTLWLGRRIAFEGRVVDERNQGIPRAQVRVYAGHLTIADLWGNLGELFSNLDREPEPLTAATTDGRGGFTFEALDPGPVTLSVRAPGYETAQVLAVVADVAGAEKLTVRLASGSIVSGRVLDGQGRGLGGARVAALAGNDPLSFLYGRAFATTADDGSFRVDAASTTDEVLLLASAPGYPVRMARVKPGDAGVEIVLDHSATLVLRLLQAPDETPVEGAHLLVGVAAPSDGPGGPGTVVSGLTDATGRSTFDVHPGKLQMVWATLPDGLAALWSSDARIVAPGQLLRGPADATLEAGRQEIVLHLLATAMLHGTVRDEAGQPIEGAQVRSFGGIQFGRPVLTDAAGRYAIPVARGAGMSFLLFGAAGYVRAQEMVRLAEGEPVPEKDVTLLRASVLSGRVVAPDGRPVAGARVRAKAAEQGTFFASGFLGEPEALTSGNGRFVLDGVTPGKGVRLLARHTSFVDAASEPFDVESGQSVRVPDLVLGTGVGLEVVVRDPDGRPLADARVELDFARGEVPNWDDLEMMLGDRTLRTDADGRARTDRVPPCTLTVTASHPKHAPAHVEREVSAQEPSPVRVDLRLRRGATVAGRVLDAAGQPVADAFVRARPEGEEDPPFRGTTDAEGRFRIENVPAGPLTLDVLATGFRHASLPIPGASETLEVRLEPVSADVAARRQEILQRMSELQQAFAGAKSDAERAAVGQEIQALSRELQSLNDDSGD